MRLTEDQRNIILNTVAKVLDENAAVTLFGSRIDSQAKGGDIDLLIEINNPIDNPADVKAEIVAKLKMAFGDQKVDVLLSAPNLKHYPIHAIAKKNGVRL